MSGLASLSRRQFIGTSLAAGVTVGCSGVLAPPARRAALPEPSPGWLPRWRGFNLLGKFNGRNDRFVEQDFAWIAELGFNFVRLPMDYRAWVEAGDWTNFRERTFKDIDDAIRLGETHGVHVCLNFHRAPGYTVARPPEVRSVWADEEALRVCALHWRYFAQRYRGVPNRQLSFNPFNEPPRIAPETHKGVVARIVEAIREDDPQRLIICDGRNWGREPPTELVGLGVAAATRGYRPMRITHYRAPWISGAEEWEEPVHPVKEGAIVWDKSALRERTIGPWKALEAQGVGVMVGEFGVFNKTPHEVALASMRDALHLWKETGWGWAMWNFRGHFGILDSDRVDVKYEDWRGSKLDRAMLELIQSL